MDGFNSFDILRNIIKEASRDIDRKLEETKRTLVENRHLKGEEREPLEKEFKRLLKLKATFSGTKIIVPKGIDAS